MAPYGGPMERRTHTVAIANPTVHVKRWGVQIRLLIRVLQVAQVVNSFKHDGQCPIYIVGPPCTLTPSLVLG